MMSSEFPVIDVEATGRNIKRLREANGLSVRALQSCFGFEQPQAIYNWQWGKTLPSIDNLCVLSRLFNKPIEQILVFEDRDLHFYGEMCQADYGRATA